MVYGLWFIVQGGGIAVWGMEFRVYGLVFMVYGLWFMVWGAGLMVQGLGFRVYNHSEVRAVVGFMV